MNALAVAVQGLGFDAAYVALQGLLSFVEEEVKKHEAGGGGRVIGRPFILPVYTPVHARRPRKRRHSDLLFLGN